ncbi:sensor histidine kinase [Pseudonocardia hispaniensis]|uniref:histidine kinase n=1 Tax=Pseudonocardia hispaniensis TaxID=904933 RepID=A0ABW1J3F2_9PSEU
MTETRRRLRVGPRSVRLRTTLAAVVVVALATSAGAMLLLTVLRGLLTDELAAAAQSRAMQIATTLHTSPSRPVLAVGDLEDDVAQLVAPDGRVLAASPNAAGRPPVVWPAPEDPVEIVGPVDAEPLLVVAHRMDGEVVIVARTVDSRDDALRFVADLLMIGLPILLLIVAVLTWVLVGRALRPVESIRREVDEISSTALHRRVPEPAGSDEIARLSRTMNRMLDRLERAQQRQRRFASDASHELRSPVAAIRQSAEVALAHPGRTSVPELARTVLEEDLRVQHLVEDLLLLARMDEHLLQLRTVPLDLDDLVFAEARRLREAGGLRVDTSGVSAGQVSGDPDGLRRVLANLADNAARHARSRIVFTLAETSAGVVLTVDDDGPGIPPGERERVLERFVRLDDARARDAGGSGLGLAIVSELVTAHGGSLEIADSPDGGARLRLTFPPSPAQASPRSFADRS